MKYLDWLGMTSTAWLNFNSLIFYAKPWTFLAHLARAWAARELARANSLTKRAKIITRDLGYLFILNIIHSYHCTCYLVRPIVYLLNIYIICSTSRTIYMDANFCAIHAHNIHNHHNKKQVYMCSSSILLLYIIMHYKLNSTKDVSRWNFGGSRKTNVWNRSGSDSSWMKAHRITRRIGGFQGQTQLSRSLHCAHFGSVDFATGLQSVNVV